MECYTRSFLESGSWTPGSFSTSIAWGVSSNDDDDDDWWKRVVVIATTITREARAL